MAASTTAPKPERLSWFQDQKFGFFAHWGPYSQLGCLESWPLVWKDRSWSNPAVQTREQMDAFRKQYRDLPRTFNPVLFDPSSWARLAKRAGMRYAVFTTKHHDGFSMFDTRLSDYRITHPSVPFSRHKYANITKEVFNAFRAEDFGIGAYFSKSDWHSPDYWKPGVWPEDRNPNYDTAADPATWRKFTEFVHGQARELMTGYGPIDILWLDGGQVRPPKQDIQMDKLVAMARGFHPNLLVANRTAGEHEDFLTPEQKVLAQPDLEHVWESCMTMGDRWAFTPNDKYKSARTLIHTLVDVVAKGGNLLLNVGPQPDGLLPPEAVQRLEEIGDWMSVCSEAIHDTRPLAPYRSGSWAFTQQRNSRYAIYLTDGELPAQLLIPGATANRVSLVGLRGGQPIRSRATAEGTLLDIPEDTRALPPCQHAFAFRLSTGERRRTF